MNRAQRRNQKFGRTRPTHKEVSLYPLHLLNHCRPYETGETLDHHFATHDAFIRLRDGTASEDDFLRVGTALNLAMARAAEIDESLAKLLGPSHDAMNTLRQRYELTQCLRLAVSEVEPVAEGLRYAQTIMDASSPQQMIQAEKTMRRIQAEQSHLKLVKNKLKAFITGGQEEHHAG